MRTRGSIMGDKKTGLDQAMDFLSIVVGGVDGQIKLDAQRSAYDTEFKQKEAQLAVAQSNIDVSKMKNALMIEMNDDPERFGNMNDEQFTEYMNGLPGRIGVDFSLYKDPLSKMSFINSVKSLENATLDTVQKLRTQNANNQIEKDAVTVLSSVISQPNVETRQFIDYDNNEVQQELFDGVYEKAKLIGADPKVANDIYVNFAKDNASKLGYNGVVKYVIDRNLAGNGTPEIKAIMDGVSTYEHEGEFDVFLNYASNDFDGLLEDSSDMKLTNYSRMYNKALPANQTKMRDVLERYIHNSLDTGVRSSVVLKSPMFKAWYLMQGPAYDITILPLVQTTIEAEQKEYDDIQKQKKAKRHSNEVNRYSSYMSMVDDDINQDGFYEIVEQSTNFYNDALDKNKPEILKLWGQKIKNMLLDNVDIVSVKFSPWYALWKKNGGELKNPETYKVIAQADNKNVYEMFTVYNQDNMLVGDFDDIIRSNMRFYEKVSSDYKEKMLGAWGQILIDDVKIRSKSFDDLKDSPYFQLWYSYGGKIKDNPTLKSLSEYAKTLQKEEKNKRKLDLHAGEVQRHESFVRSVIKNPEKYSDQFVIDNIFIGYQNALPENQKKMLDYIGRDIRNMIEVQGYSATDVMKSPLFGAWQKLDGTNKDRETYKIVYNKWQIELLNNSISYLGMDADGQLDDTPEQKLKLYNDNYSDMSPQNQTDFVKHVGTAIQQKLDSGVLADQLSGMPMVKFWVNNNGKILNPETYSVIKSSVHKDEYNRYAQYLNSENIYEENGDIVQNNLMNMWDNATVPNKSKMTSATGRWIINKLNDGSLSVKELEQHPVYKSWYGQAGNLQNQSVMSAITTAYEKEQKDNDLLALHDALRNHPDNGNVVQRYNSLSNADKDRIDEIEQDKLTQKYGDNVNSIRKESIVYTKNLGRILPYEKAIMLGVKPALSDSLFEPTSEQDSSIGLSMEAIREYTDNGQLDHVLALFDKKSASVLKQALSVQDVAGGSNMYAIKTAHDIVNGLYDIENSDVLVKALKYDYPDISVSPELMRMVNTQYSIFRISTEPGRAGDMTIDWIKNNIVTQDFKDGEIKDDGAGFVYKVNPKYALSNSSYISGRDAVKLITSRHLYNDKFDEYFRPLIDLDLSDADNYMILSSRGIIKNRDHYNQFKEDYKPRNRDDYAVVLQNHDNNFDKTNILVFYVGDNPDSLAGKMAIDELSMTVQNNVLFKKQVLQVLQGEQLGIGIKQRPPEIVVDSPRWDSVAPVPPGRKVVRDLFDLLGQRAFEQSQSQFNPDKPLSQKIMQGR